MDNKKLLLLARNHFERSTGFQTQTIRLRELNTAQWESHCEIHDLHNTAIATSIKRSNEHIITIKADLTQTLPELFCDFLHEISHEFHRQHNKAFYALLEQCGVQVGRGYNDLGYRSETWEGDLPLC